MGNLLLKLWGIVLLCAGGYCFYTMVNILFIQGKIATLSAFWIALFLVGLLLGVTLIYIGFNMITLRMKGREKK